MTVEYMTDKETSFLLRFKGESNRKPLDNSEI